MIDKIIELTLELLQCIVEQIWYHRSVYPPESFENARCFQLPVHMTRHPDVKRYLADVTSKIKSFLERGKLNRLFVEIYPPDSAVRIETYGFSLTNSPLLEALRADAELSEEFKLNVLYAEYQAFLYSVINELQTATKLTPPSSFKILVSTDNSEFNRMLSQDWILHRTQMPTSTQSSESATARIHDFRQVSLPYLNIKGYRAEHLPF
ncbi:hypothetical protein KL921_001413 [Ogataea angusta]|uniref:HORMA domain-containing protein n=1 Tax=Pichia angusta TaxID=870730 RepID=A0ABQ7S066_PICAN|nr:hypothetical protein KL921_001413 [Ogataea angusta]KAG7825028.1 hypothetical protein KL909_001320 [Ogataea angusta]KAG7830215.1 hypothetical protein KL920_001853 [Ogataea angusta]KAG7834653.1 hypothetical protein KL943_003037 [Ogataea angusta]KAG7841679.1 hypothetical protein KL942_001558 [Ogataea angusta]